MLPLLLLGLRSLLAAASNSPDLDDDDDGVVEDEIKAGDIPGFPGGKMPSAAELLKMLDTMSGITDEEKETLRRDLLKSIKGGAPEAAGAADFAPEAESHLIAAGSFFSSQFFVLLALLSLITLIFGNFCLCLCAGCNFSFEVVELVRG